MYKNKVVGFEIPAADFVKAKAFYGSVFDWKLDPMGDEGFMVETIKSDEDQNPLEPGGINGGIYKRESARQQPSFMVETESIDDTLKRVEQAGGKVLAPKHPLDGMGFMADIADPEGNEITLWEKAKQ